jgi:hypothetical protein
MAYSAIKLVNDAFFVSGVVSHEFQTLSGPQLSYGLGLLNDSIGDKAVEQDMIPYYTTQYTFNSVAGQQEYQIDNLVDVSTLTFFIGDIRYSMQNVSRDLYFGSSRANNIESLPLTFHFERSFEGGKIFLYFYPDRAYRMELTGLFRLNEITVNQDLQLTLDRFYINYLKYDVATRICMEYNYEIPANVSKMLLKYEQKIADMSAPLDLRTKIISAFNNATSINYAQVNLGKGFTVGFAGAW